MDDKKRVLSYESKLSRRDFLARVPLSIAAALPVVSFFSGCGNQFSIMKVSTNLASSTQTSVSGLAVAGNAVAGHP